MFHDLPPRFIKGNRLKKRDFRRGKYDGAFGPSIHSKSLSSQSGLHHNKVSTLKNARFYSRSPIAANRRPYPQANNLSLDKTVTSRSGASQALAYPSPQSPG